MTLGIDMEDVGRFKLPKTHAFVRKIFTEKEIIYAYSKKKSHVHLCGMFCAKEAIRKAGIGSSLLMREIEIDRDHKGKPFAKLAGKKSRFEISISHTNTHAIACALRRNGRH